MSVVSRRDSALPSKLFFRIGEVAGLVGVEPHVLRYWEREFRSIRPTKSAKGQRVYSRKDVESLLRVRDLLYRDGFTIAGAKKRLQVGQEAALEGAEDLDRATAPEGDGPFADSPLAHEPQAIEVVELSGAPSGAISPLLQDKLTALRAEVEAFLDELETGG
jgi:DNA-binding transcriptional MerR regulator